MTKKKNVSIDTFSVGRLMVQEDYGFQTLAKEAIVKLPLEVSAPGFSPRLKQSVDDFNTAYGEFDDALKAAAALPSVAAAAKYDKERDDAWNAIYSFVKSTTRHPNTEVADIAIVALKHFKKYGNALRMNQSAETGVLNNLLQDLHALGNEKLTKAGLKPFVDDLEQKQKAFIQSVTPRSDEEGARLVGIVKEKRTAADEAYRDLVYSVNALVHLNGDEHFKGFILNLNALIKRQEEQVELRQTMAKKRAEKHPKDPKTPKEPKEPKEPKQPKQPGGGDDIHQPEEPPKKPEDKDKPKQPEGGGDDIHLPEEPPKKPGDQG
ncbi:hypothetical protein BHU16_00100 [Tannerella sp. oral taxon 808]|nr:hypothetical protein BHU16_00100 [Tannerella sp. oral taxon 808]